MAKFFSSAKKVLPRKKVPMWRHGDVFIAAVSKIPPNSKKLPNCVLAEGELTGHAHRINERNVAELYESNQPDTERFLRVTAETATLIHEEHHAIELPRGEYRVWIQREYSPEAIRRVID